MWPVFEIVLEGISELVEFVGSVLYSAPKGFLTVIILSFWNIVLWGAAYMCSSQDPLQAQTICFFFTSVTNLLIATVIAGAEK